MKKVIVFMLCLFLLAMPMASASKIDELQTKQDKINYILSQMKKYRTLIELSKEDSSMENCLKISNGDCLPYTDIYDGWASLYVYYANQE